MNKSSQARCPFGNIAVMVCVSEKCRASPFMCGGCLNLGCRNAHQYCKVMQFSSLLSMLQNYRINAPEAVVRFVDRIEKVYRGITDRIKKEEQLFHESVQKALYGQQYLRVLHFLEKQQYKKITCLELGTVVTAMTTPHKAKLVDQFSLSEMSSLEDEVCNLIVKIETLYKSRVSQISSRSNQSPSMSQRLSQSCSNISAYSSRSMILKKAELEVPEMSKSKVMKQSQVSSVSTFDQSFLIKADLCYPKAIQSKIISNASILTKFLMRKVKAYKLLYRASEHSFEIEEFYRAMNKNQRNRSEKVLTLILARTQYGKTVGGFTKLRWDRQKKVEEDSDEQHSRSSLFKSDIGGSTILFSVDLNQWYRLEDPCHAIYCGSRSIGFGRKDLRIVNHAHKHNNCIGFPCSFNNGFYLPIKKSSLALSGCRDSTHFKLTEWEAFEVVMLENTKV